MNLLLHKTYLARAPFLYRKIKPQIKRGESKSYEERKRRIRERYVNKTDPAYTGEGAIQNWDEKKGKSLYKFMANFVNFNRFTRNIPANEKEEYINKQKEYSLYLLDKYRKEKAYNDMVINHQKDILDSAALLPIHLKVELKDNAIVYFSNKSPNDNIGKAELVKKRFRFTADHLYLEQKMRLMPDEARMVERVLRNSYVDEPDNEIPQAIADAWEETNENKKI